MKAAVHAADGSIIPGKNVSEALRNLEFYNSLEPVRSARFLVTWGLGESERTLPTFAGALALYTANIDARGGIKIWNIDRMVDGEDDGLTDEERAEVEAADEAHTAEVA